MKILSVGVLAPTNGGAGLSLAQISLSLVKLGARVRYIAPVTRECLPRAREFAERNPSLEVIRYLVPYPERLVYLAPEEDYVRHEREQLERLLPDQIDQFQPDLIVIGRESFARTIPDLMVGSDLPIVQFLSGAPAVQIIQGTYPKDWTARMLRGFRKADRIISVAEHITQGFQKLGFSNVITIPNAIDLDRFRPRAKDRRLFKRFNIEADASVVLCAGSLISRKRPLDAVRSAALASDLKRYSNCALSPINWSAQSPVFGPRVMRNVRRVQLFHGRHHDCAAQPFETSCYEHYRAPRAFV